MIRSIVDVAAEFNFGIEPIISFSDQHYLKAIVRLRRGAEGAFNCQNQAGYLSFCKTCAWRTASRFPEKECGFCHSQTDWAGPLWLGELHDGKTIQSMAGLNKQRAYADKNKLARFLALMEGEIGMPAAYYNMHELCKLHKIQPVPKFDSAMEAITGRGYKARGTHFSPICFKSDAPLKDILEALGWKN
jgi:tRNA (guanine26-N2/guanine27-N2)-dimethyltransferase